MRTAKKSAHRKPAPSMRKNRPEQKKNSKKTETASKTGANQKTLPYGKQEKGGNVDSTCNQVSRPTGRRTGRFSKARRRETKCRILWSMKGLHHARHPVESRKKGEGTDLTRFVFDQTRWAQVDITAQKKSVPLGENEKMVTCDGLASRRGVDGGGGGGGGGGAET